VLAASIIAPMMKAVSTPETSVNFYKTTRRNISEDGNLHTSRRENMKSRLSKISFNIIYPQAYAYVLHVESYS
jgi:hypothetical protein